MLSNSGSIDFLITCIEKEQVLSAILDLDAISALCSSEDAEIRAFVAQALAFEEKSAIAVPLLYRLTKDQDYLVRIDAIESLCCFPCMKSYAAMKEAILDFNELVRAYAFFGVAIIGKEMMQEDAKLTLLNAQRKESAPHALVGIYEGLYILGQEHFMTHLFALFHETNDYHIQCAVLNALSEIRNQNNDAQIKSFAKEILSSNYPRAVTSSAKKLSK